MLVRFVAGRPVSAITTAFLAWLLAYFTGQGKRALFLIWDNASRASAVEAMVLSGEHAWISEPTVRVVFYFSLLAALISAVPMAWAWQTPTPAQWGLLLVVGATGTLGQLLLTRGYAVAPAGRLAPFIYFSVIFGALYGYLLWDEQLHLSFALGAVLIAIAGTSAVRARETKTSPDAKAARVSVD